MLVRPEIAALRQDDTPQREAQAALTEAFDAWADRAQSRAVFADMALYAGGAALDDCPALAAIFAGDGAAALWVGEWAKVMLRGLCGHPLGHVPLRHGTNGVVSTLLLGRSGEAMLALVAVDGAALARQPASSGVSFAPIDSHEYVLAGSARGQIITCAGPGEMQTTLTSRDIDLRPEMAITLDGAREALRLSAAEGVLVSLRLQRRQPRGHVTQEYDLSTGQLRHRAAAAMRESRHALMVNLLGRMGRRDALPILTEIAREEASDDLRWQALRETLGLDTAQGFRLLSEIAGREGDPLAPPARRLQAQLLAQYPMLAEIA